MLFQNTALRMVNIELPPSSCLDDYHWCLYDNQYWAVQVYSEDEGMAIGGEQFPLDAGDLSWRFVKFLGDVTDSGLWADFDTQLSVFSWTNTEKLPPAHSSPVQAALVAWARICKENRLVLGDEKEAMLSWCKKVRSSREPSTTVKVKKETLKVAQGENGPSSSKGTAAQRIEKLSTLHTPGKGEDKRLTRVRQMSVHVSDRLSRALKERMFLVKQEIRGSDEGECIPSGTFTVIGSTGNIYTVTIDLKPSCNCPDFRSRDNVCKHIMFVLCRVLGVPRTSSFIPQRALVKKELQQLFTLAPKRVASSVSANIDVKIALGFETPPPQLNKRGPEKKVEEETSLKPEGDCAICCEVMQVGGTSASTRTMRCQQCKNFLHVQCFTQYKRFNKAGVCPLCRQPFEASGAAGGEMSPQASTCDSMVRRTSSMGSNYQNVAMLQPGVSMARDTSSYRTNEWSERNFGGFEDKEPPRRRRRYE